MISILNSRSKYSNRTITYYKSIGILVTPVTKLLTKAYLVSFAARDLYCFKIAIAVHFDYKSGRLEIILSIMSEAQNNT